MSEHVRTNRDRAATPHSSPVASFETTGGGEHRIDAAHHDAASNPAPPAGALPTGRFARDEQLLLQASQIAEHLRSQFEDLSRREQTANTHLAWIDQERRTVRFWVQQFQEEIRERETSLEARSRDLEARELAQRGLAEELDHLQADLDRQRAELSAERLRLRDELQGELDNDRAALECSRCELLEERGRLQRQAEQHELQHAAALERLERELDESRQALRAEIEQEFVQEREALAREQERWQAHHAAAAAELAQARELQDEAARQTERELEQQRLEQAQRLEQELAECERRLTQEREAAELDLLRLRELWDAQKQTELAQREREREQHEQDLAQARHAFESERERQQAELDLLRRDFEDSLAQERAAFERECAASTSAFQQETALQENRFRLQQDHLSKTRRELEVAQLQHRLEVQQWRERSERDETMLRLRLTQLDHYRALLDEREMSIDRERELLAQAGTSLHAGLKRDRNRLQADRDAWEHERQAQRAEIRRQQDVLALHAQNLESRRIRLDHLRGELEETHRNTLEMRMAVEDVWAQIAQVHGDDAAAESVAAAKAALAEHYRHLEDVWRTQQQEIEESRARFRAEQNEFQAERAQLIEWIAERDEHLTIREEGLQVESLAIQKRETDWAAARESWMHEKIEAETVIRELLRQLTDLNHPEAA